MDFRRLILFSALLFIGLNLYQGYLKEYPNQQPQPIEATDIAPTETAAKANESYVPDIKTAAASNESRSEEQPVVPAPQKAAQTISIQTDVLKLELNAATGNVIDAQLLKYGQSSSELNKPFQLLMDDLRKYVANSSIVVKTKQGVQNLNVIYHSDRAVYQLEPSQASLVVNLQGETADGIKVTKSYTFKRGSYAIDLSYQIQNDSDNAWTGQVNTQLLQKNPIEDKSSMFHVGTYSGGAISDPSDKLYKKISFSDIQSTNFDRKVESGWIAMQQHYFLTAWIPAKGTENHFYSRYINSQYILGMITEPFTLAAGKSKLVESKLYTGPEITSTLKQLAPGLDLTVDYGILSVISIFLFSVMSFIHKYIGNWGWSIVLVTCLIKLVFYRLSAKSYKSMASMRRIQPKITELKERYGEDKAKLSQATMELYRKEQVNPLGGCLPILIQIPVFIALYWVLLESVELRQAPWVLWIHDLSEPDPFYILPIIMGASMFIQQKLGPASPDPTQAKMMMMLPLLFTFLFSSFPAGLVLYWTVNNTLSILQQWYITRKYGDTPPKKKPKGSIVANKKLAMSK